MDGRSAGRPWFGAVAASPTYSCLYLMLRLLVTVRVLSYCYTISAHRVEEDFGRS